MARDVEYAMHPGGGVSGNPGRNAAREALTAAGLSVGSEQVVEDTAAKNTVLSQEPAAGTMVAPGTAVDYRGGYGPADLRYY